MKSVMSAHPDSSQQEPISSQAQTSWLQWVEAAFPDLDSRAYFLPPVYVNRVPMTTQSIAGREVRVFTSAAQSSHTKQSPTSPSSASPTTSPTLVQDSDVRDDATMRRLLMCLRKMSDQSNDVMVVLSQLQFGHYLGEPSYAAATTQLPRLANLPPALPKSWKRGDFDVLFIHRHYGFVVCEVKTFGDNLQQLNLSQHDIDTIIRKKLIESVKQLDKADAVLSHLVSDVCPGLRITKTIAVPNLTTRHVQQVISGDSQLSQDLCRCLGTTKDPADITGVCLCCDQLSDPKTPCDVSSHVLRELGHWWQRRVAGAGPDTHLTPGVYKTLVARFCGPATTVTIPCTCPPRVSVKTLGQAVWCTGECYTAVITLFPEQVHLLHTAPPRLFVAGPPGTGKTVVLLLMAIQWLRCGSIVHIISSGKESLAGSIMLYHLLLQDVNTHHASGATPGQPHLLQYDFHGGNDVEKAVNDLSQAAGGGPVYVIADETGPEYRSHFQTFCDKLLIEVPSLHLWAANCYHGHPPAGWQVQYLTRPLRSPPVVVSEVEQDREISRRNVQAYIERGVADHTDGPPVKRISHRGGHSSRWAGDCVACGREVASFLHSLRVGVEGNTTTSATDSISPPCLQWRDVLLLYLSDIYELSGIVAGLMKSGIPVQLMTDDDIEDVATARSDVVWVASGGSVRGLERKVVVCISPLVGPFRLKLISRCTSQLVIVD